MSALLERVQADFAAALAESSAASALMPALVRDDARVLLLDEPTSRLDSGTEEAVLRATRRLASGRTALIVAHRPVVLGEVDRVVAFG